MAKTGLEYVVVARLKMETALSKDTETYADGRYLGPASTLNGTPNTSDVKDYGDNYMVETDTSVTGGTLTLELNEDTLEINAMILGHAFDAVTGDMVCNAEDIAPFLGVGCVGKTVRGGKKVYSGKFYYKVQFREPSDENATRQETTTFSHTTYEGDIFALDNGDWKSAREFQTAQEAKVWLNDTIGANLYRLDGMVTMDGIINFDSKIEEGA